MNRSELIDALREKVSLSILHDLSYTTLLSLYNDLIKGDK